MSDPKFWTYLLYLALSIWMTIWVGRVLFRNGQVFLEYAFEGREILAVSVNHLLVVAFYLINLGLVATFMRIHQPISTAVMALEALVPKLGQAMLLIGLMHGLNIVLLFRQRRRIEPAGGEALAIAGSAAADA